MKRFLGLACLTVLFLPAFGASAMAQDLDADGKKLKSMFQALVQEPNTTPANNDVQINFDGDVSVEKAGQYYAITLPFMSINYKDGSHFDIGLIGVNAAPHSVEGQWKMTFALPADMTFKDNGGGELFTVNIGAQRSSGVWSEALGYFSKLDANFETITLNNPSNGFTMTIPNARAVYDLDRDQASKWSGPIYFSFNDITAIADNVEGNVLEIGALNLNMELFQYDPAAMQTYRTQLQDFIALKNADEPVSDSQIVSNLINSFISILGDGFTSEYQVNDLMIKGPPQSASTNLIKLDNAHAGIDVTGFTTDKVNLSLRLGYDNFTLDPMPETLPALAPNNVNIDLTVTDIPFQDLIDMSKNTLDSSLGSPNMANMAAMSLAFRLPALLSKANTALLIDDNYYGNDMYHVNLDGKVTTDLTAANSATADIKATVRGLDRVITFLSEQTQQGNDTARTQQMLATLAVLKGLGANGTNDQGETTHNYDLVMSKDGKILLNGQDISLITSMLGGLSPAAAAPSPEAANTRTKDQSAPAPTEEPPIQE
ncbi:MAG: hypothetical protein CMH27_09470 [Micavibrio sp.]|nr:hypothetical protein [Micavibrio sp.]